MIKLSIIIPVYNTEVYLRKCLSSCVDQVTDEVEIIVVNDGSPDKSQNIIDDFCAKYSCIHAIQQQNKGLSFARNVGLEKAIGEYVWFVDSDDWIEPNAIKQILNSISNYPDLVVIRRVCNEDNLTHSILNIDSGKQILSYGKFEHGAVFYVYNRSFWDEHKLSFKPGIYHEDSELIPRVLYFAKTCVYIRQPLYNVTINPQSITRVSNSKKSYDLIIVAKSLLNFRQNAVKEKQYRRIFDNIIATVINSAFANIVKSDETQQQVFNTHIYQNRYVLQSLNRSNIKYKIEYILWKCFPKRYVQIYQLLKKLE